MNEEAKKGPYPWGRTTPGMRLGATAERAQRGLEQAKAPGLAQLEERWTKAVRAAQPLVETLDYVSRAGFRGKRGQESLSGADVAKATRAVHDALGAFVASTVFSVSERYEAFATAVEVLIGLAEKAGNRGVAGSGHVASDDPWETFKR